MSEVQKASRVEVLVDATVQQVWDVVSDVTRVGEWSHECRGARWLGATHAALPGAQFRGRNRAGWAIWSRQCEIVAVDPPRELAWRTVPSRLLPDSTLWRIELEAHGTQTRITQSFQVLLAPWLLDRFFAAVIPPHRDRDLRLAEDLLRIGDVARGATPARTGS
ncbi:MAG: SRPBCC family protein [Candidatus Nanopelagicales bacterium]